MVAFRNKLTMNRSASPNGNPQKRMEKGNCCMSLKGSRNLHKETSLALFFYLVLGSSLLFGQDGSPPVLVSLDFSPKLVNVSDSDQTVTTDLRITDNLSGVNQLSVLFKKSGTQTAVSDSVTAAASLISGDFQDGIYRVQVTVRRFSPTGNWILIITATDSVGNALVCDATCLAAINAPSTLVVTAGNSPPVVTNPGTQSNGNGDSVSLQIQASDPDGDTLTYSAIGLPPGLSIGSNSGLISGTLGLNSETYAVFVSASDGSISTSVNFQWLVNVAEASGTVLVANFMNGNNESLNSRVYLWNTSESSGNVSVRVFTLPIRGGTPQELTNTPLDIRTLRAKSAVNIKLAEDILAPLGIVLPYTTDGGNLTLEFTIGATGVGGSAQVFSSSLALGTYPLQEIPSTASVNPTVLAAHFMNGNNASLNSRVYLWNPSASAGNITVRVFTLPLSGGSNQELTPAPLSLGALAAKSALNVKLIEDILIPLGIPTPYTTDGGNLTLEFTITAENVRGIAQVFSSDLAFGTYPMQVIQ